MTDPLFREIEWLNGIDPRALDRSERSLGYIRGSDWEHPNISGFSRYAPDCGYVGATSRPFLTTVCPFSADAAGVAFPGGQVYAVFVGGPNAGTGMTTARTPGDTTNPLTVPYPAFVPTTDQSNRTNYAVYHATQVPAGADATIDIYDSLGTLLATTVIASRAFTGNITRFIDPVGPFDPISDPTPYCVITWYGGLPATEGIGLHQLNTATYVPIPTSLDAAYTARYDSDVERGGDLIHLGQSDRRRVYASRSSFEPSVPSGIAAYNQAVFMLADRLKSNPWLPFGYNGQVYDISAFINSWPSSIPAPYPLPNPMTTTVTTVGARALTLDVTCNAGTGETFKIEVYSDATLLYTNTFTGNSSGISISPLSLPTPGTTVDYSVKAYAPSGMAHWNGGVTGQLRISPRIDIPYPFAMVGRDPDGTVLAAPGGYLAGSVTDYHAVGSNVTRLTAGTTTSAGKASFIVASDGWWQTKNGGGTLIAGGEDDFGAGDNLQIDRGHQGKIYYIAAAGSISSYTPSPVSVSSGGTDLTPTKGNWWEWGNISLGSAGNWSVTFFCKNAEMLKRGFIVDWSLSETTVIHPDGRLVFETLDESAGLGGGSFYWAGTTATPPASPTVYDAYVIDTGATGAWAGKEGKWTTWDDFQNAWRYFSPSFGSYLINAAGTDWTWYNGTTWKGKSDAVLTLGVHTSGAATLGLAVKQFCRDRSVSTDPKVTVKWAAA